MHRACALFVMLVGCTRTETPVADPATTAPATPRPVSSAEVLDVATHLAPPQYGDDASAPLAIGASCTDTALCGTQKRVALHVERFHGPTPRDACVGKNVGPPDASPMLDTTSACVAGDRLYVRSYCTMCRMMSGSSIEAVIPELTAAQREHLRQRLGLTGSLVAVSDWQTALARITAP
jgi:hypothetical protein